MKRAWRIYSTEKLRVRRPGISVLALSLPAGNATERLLGETSRGWIKVCDFRTEKLSAGFLGAD
jgi:hypothetical protein